MSGGGHSQTVYNWQLDPSHEIGKRIRDGKDAEPRVEVVKCDYCGRKTHVFEHSIMQKCPSCGARK
jgi:hypothetical protein